MTGAALQEIQANLIAAYLEVSELQSHFEMKDADFAVLRDHLDAIARTVEEMGEIRTASHSDDYEHGSPAPSASYPASNSSPAERPSTL